MAYASVSACDVCVRASKAPNHARVKQMVAPPFRRKSSSSSPAQIQAELDLTSEQARRSEEVIVSMKQKKGAILDRWETDRARLHKKLKADMEALMDETEGKLATFLSAEQAKRLREAYAPDRFDRRAR